MATSRKVAEVRFNERLRALVERAEAWHLRYEVLLNTSAQGPEDVKRLDKEMSDHLTLRKTITDEFMTLVHKKMQRE